MPNVPACVGLTCNETVRVRAMLSGKSDRELWLDFAYFDWALSYCIDQLSRHGIVSTHVEDDTIERTPNLDGVEAVWKGWDTRFRRYSFAFVQEVPGLPPGNLNVRRHMPLSGLTDELWEKFAVGDMSLATQGEKKTMATRRSSQYTSLGGDAKCACVRGSNVRRDRSLSCHAQWQNWSRPLVGL